MTPLGHRLTCRFLSLVLLASCAHADPADRPPAVPGVLTGAVLDAAGPAAGVRVLLTRAVPEQTLSHRSCPSPDERSGALFCLPGLGRPTVLQDVLAGRREALRIAEAVTDAEGRFRFEGLEPQDYAVWAGRGVGEVADAYVPELRGETHVLLGLRTGLAVENTVVTEEGKPVPDAEVVAVHDWHTRYFRTRTDAAGRFRFEGLPDGDFTFVFAARGRAPRREDVNTTYAAGRPILLPALRALRGKVTQDGRAVEGAQVSVLGDPIVSTRTASDGSFTFADVGPGFYVFVAETPGASAAEPVRWEPGEPVPEVHLALQRGGPILGTVRDTRGRPVKGVRFELSGASVMHVDWALAPAATRGDGGFSTRSLPAGIYTLTAIGPDGLRLTRSVRVEPGGARVHVTLPEGHPVRLTVRDSAGEPVAGLPVTLVTPTPGEQNPHADLDATGSVHFSVSGRGKARVELSLTPWLMAFDGEQPRSGKRQFELDVPTDARVLVVEDIPSRRVEGTVTTEQGVPLPGMAVEFLPRTPGPWLPRTAYTDAAGRYVLRHVAPGSYVLDVVRRQYGSLRRWTQLVEVTDAPRQTLDVRMPRGESLELEVVDGRGAPVVGAYVELQEPAERLGLPPDKLLRYTFDGALEGHVTDQRGRVVLRDLTLPEYDVRVNIDLFTDAQRPRDTRFHVAGGAKRVRVGPGLVRVVAELAED